MSRNSTDSRPSRKTVKPPKPYRYFPLSPHPSGAWCKRINGKLHYFGKWGRVVNGKLTRVDGDGWKDALEIYQAQRDDLHAGRTPRANSDALTVAMLCNHFLTAKKRKLEAGEIGQRMFAEYKETTDRIVAAFGGHRPVDDLAAGDFGVLRADMAQRWGPVRLGNVIGRMKSVFKFGMDNGLIDRPVRFGSEFHKPTKAVLRKHKAAAGSKMLDAQQIRALMDAADVLYRALILLGVNAGYGNGDCAALTLDAVDLDGGWIDFPRPKTAIERRCKLWPETVAAIRKWLEIRPAPKDDAAAKLVFLTERGTPLIRDTEKSRTDNITMVFSAITKAAKVHRPGLGFYVLRRVFRTVGDATLDRVACDVVMGHADPSMGATYRQGIEDVRLERVAEHVRQWLFDEMRGADVAADEGADNEPSAGVRGKNERAHLRVFAG